MTPRPTDAELAKWNSILKREGLGSVRDGHQIITPRPKKRRQR